MFRRFLCTSTSRVVRRNCRIPRVAVSVTNHSRSSFGTNKKRFISSQSEEITSEDSELQSEPSILPTEENTSTPESPSTPNITIEDVASKERQDMPLRAKMNDLSSTSRVLNISGGRNQENLASDAGKPAQVIKQLPRDEKEDVLFDSLFGVRTIELNRPPKFNSLNGSMIRKIIPRLQEWTKSDMANVIIIKGVGPDAFCSGGDVVSLAKQNETDVGRKWSTNFFALEYKLDHLIATYKKPFIAFMDGITMGGGAGLSIHAPLRIATERTVFAMPETNIGLFPDIGASFFLPRLDGALGTYFALTGDQIRGADVFFNRIATHFIHSTTLTSLSNRLAELQFKDYDELPERLRLINATIEEFSTGIPHDQPMLFAGETRKAIDRCFSRKSIPDIIAALKAEEGPTKEWAQGVLEMLKKRSPTSLYVTLRLMQLGINWSIAEAFKREHFLVTKFMQKSDFVEGVNALLVRKDKTPKWDPPSLDDIESEVQIVEPYFKTDDMTPINLLNDEDFQQYPYKYTLPNEEMVKDLITEKSVSPNQVFEHFSKVTGDKHGLRPSILEILARKTTRPVTDGPLVWTETD